MKAPELERISDYVSHWAREVPDREFLIGGEARLTYAQAREQVDACAKALIAAGVRHGDRVAVFGLARPEYFISFLAASSLGAIWLGLNPKYHLPELEHNVHDAAPSIIFGILEPSDADQAEKLAALRESTPSIRQVVTRDAAVPGVSISYAEFLRQGEDVGDDRLEEARAVVRGSDVAVMVYTSGTTGRPKGALLTHRGLVLCCVVQADRWYTPQPRGLCDLPINHIGALGDICCSLMVAGGSICFMEKFSGAGALDTIERERVTFWAAVPTMFLIAMQSEGAEQRDLSSLDRVIWSGAAAPLELVRRFDAMNVKVSTSYGLTETTGSVTYTSDDGDSVEVLVETIGRPDPRYEIRIAREDGTPCDVDEPGEIQTRGDFNMAGYWNRPEASAEAFTADGWMHTGDRALLRPDGNMKVIGRMSDMFKSGGYNVYPREIELALEEHDAVDIAAVVRVPDPLFSEVGHVFVKLAPGGDASEEALRAFAKGRLANYKVPKRFYVETELPMLPNGKVDKRALTERAAGALETAEARA